MNHLLTRFSAKNQTSSPTVMSNRKKNGADDGVPDDELQGWNCKGCPSTSSNKELLWIVCCICGGDFDHKCQRLSAAHMQALNKRKDIFWVCQPCMELHCPDPEAGLLKLTTNTTTLPDLPDLTNATMLVSLEEKIGQLLEAQKTLQASFNNIQIDIIENIPKTLSQDIDSKIDNLQTKISSQIIESTNKVPAKIEASKTLANIINSNQSSSNAPLSVASLKKSHVRTI